MNLKNEFGINKLCRLQPEKTQWENDRDTEYNTRERKQQEASVRQFIHVMNSVIEYENKNSKTNSNTSTACRYSHCEDRKRKGITSDSVAQAPVLTKKLRMDCSTPNDGFRAGRNYREMLDQESPTEDIYKPPASTSPEVIPEISISSEGSTPEQRKGKKKEKTNLSDGVLAVDIEHVWNRLNDSSLEYSIGARCLESTAIRRGILQDTNVGLGNMTEDMLDWVQYIFKEANVETWTSNGSFPADDTDMVAGGEIEISTPLK